MKKQMALIVISLFMLTGCITTLKQAYYLNKAYDHNAPLPVLSLEDPKFNMESALKVQKAYIKKRLMRDFTAGYKAELTSEKSNKAFGSKGPITAMLFESGRNSGMSTIWSSDLHNPKIELEIGFIVKEPISKPLDKISELQKKIDSIVPVIEITDFSFTDMNALTIEDVVAGNAGSAQFIVGVERPWEDIDINTVSVFLTRKKKIINRGIATDAFGDQMKACLWLINQLVSQKFPIEPGNILITGNLGQILPARSGAYMADFQSLGRIYFQVH
jgi:2-keto-4-pentenoate hydratase